MVKSCNVLYLGAGLTAMIVGLAGCGSDGGDFAEPSSSTSTSASESTPTAENEQDRLSYKYFEEEEPLLFHAGEESARFMQGWDYETSEVESEPGSLEETKCEYAIELHYEVKKERTKFALILLKVPDGLSAGEHSDLGAEASFEDVRFQDDAVLGEAVGEAEWIDDAAGDFIIMGRGSTTSETADIHEYVINAVGTMSITLTELSDDE